MPRRRFVAFALLAFGGAAGVSHGMPPANETWHRTLSKHFEIIGNASPGDAKAVAIEFERFRAFMELGEQQSAEPERMTVLLFKNEASFAPYKKSASGEVLGYLGLFSETPAGVYIAMRADLKQETFRVVYHEYTHYDLSKKPLFVPLWFHEGMAEYLSTFRSDDSRVILGEPVESHVLTLRLLPWMRWESCSGSRRHPRTTTSRSDRTSSTPSRGVCSTTCGTRGPSCTRDFKRSSRP